MTIPDPTPALPQPGEPTAARPTRHEIIPAFTPVPRQKERSDGWKPEVQRRFVEALADTGSVTAACRMVGRSDTSAYQLRRHPEAEEFRRAWDAALDIAVRQIEAGVMDRAINGVQVPVHSKGGELVGYRTVFNERLTTFMLQTRAPERFGGLRRHQGAKGDNAIDRMELARHKKQWRKEWEAEQEAKAPSVAEIHRSLLRKVFALRLEACEEIRAFMFEPYSPEVQALWDRFEAARDAERQTRGLPDLPSLRDAEWRGLRWEDVRDAWEEDWDGDADGHGDNDGDDDPDGQEPRGIPRV